MKTKTTIRADLERLYSFNKEDAMKDTKDKLIDDMLDTILSNPCGVSGDSLENFFMRAASLKIDAPKTVAKVKAISKGDYIL